MVEARSEAQPQNGACDFVCDEPDNADEFGKGIDFDMIRQEDIYNIFSGGIFYFRAGFSVENKECKGNLYLQERVKCWCNEQPMFKT